MNILIGYASMSGNTEDIAMLLKQSLIDAGHDVTTTDDVEGIDLSTLTTYDGILFGGYTWGDGDLPYEMDDIVDELRSIDLNQLPCAAFGSGDTDYPKFCAAVDTIEAAFAQANATVTLPGLKIEFDPNTDAKREACLAFAAAFDVAIRQTARR